MAGFTPYDRVSFAEYTPMSAQEILMPGQMMAQRHDQLDMEYAALDGEVQKAAFIAQQAEREGDTAAAQQYNNYAQSIAKSRDVLMERGVNNSSLRDMLSLKSKYQSTVQPMIGAYELRAKEIDQYNQMIAKDPTYMGDDPSKRTLSSYINSGLTPNVQRGYSGAMLAKQAENMAENFAQLADNPMQFEGILMEQFGNRLTPQQYRAISRQGFTPGTEAYNVINQLIKDKVFASSGLGQEHRNMADQFMDQGTTALIGKANSQMIANQDYDLEKKLQLQDRLDAREELKARLKAQAAAAKGSRDGQNLLWSPHTREASIIELEDQEQMLRDTETYLKQDMNKLIEDKSKQLLVSLGGNPFLQSGSNSNERTASIERAADTYLANNTDSNLNNLVNILNEDRPQHGRLTGEHIKATLSRTNNLGIIKNQLDNILAENPNMSEQEILDYMRNDFNAKRTQTNTSWLSTNTAVEGFQNNVFNEARKRINSRDVFIQDSKNGKKINSLPSDVQVKDLQPIGMNWYNPNVSKPTYDFIAFKDNNESIVVSIPMAESSGEYKVINYVSKINKAIVESNNINNRTVELNGQVFNIRMDSMGYYIQEKGKQDKTYVSDLENVAKSEIETLWMMGSTPHAKLFGN